MSGTKKTKPASAKPAARPAERPKDSASHDPEADFERYKELARGLQATPKKTEPPH
jgi:hypothetical protein